METQFRSGLEGQSAAAETVLGLIDSYLIHAKSGIFIGIGLIMLFWTILSLTYNIERTFNYIWQVKKPRTLYRKMTDYFSILLTSSAINRIVKRYIHLHDNDAEEHGRFRIAGTANEIYGQTYPFHTHMGYVYRTVCVYAQHKGKKSNTLSYPVS